MYLFFDFRKAEENKTCNEKLLESYLGTTAQRGGGTHNTREVQGKIRTTGPGCCNIYCDIWQILFRYTVATCIFRVQHNWVKLSFTER